ncbi:MAG: insulinase family protein [Spirochaetaceae bacterium]
MKNNKKIGTINNGFKLIEISDLNEYQSNGYEYLHLKTGLRLFHIHNNDPENTFSFSFNTPITSSNGIPHIIEHSVLSGSRLYDLKDPFQAMMTGSVNTFLNAFTFPDKTAYPASSVLEKDFFNLMSVYADAVFFPKLTKETFLQEGFRTCINEEGNLYYSGVVYNEMKGVYSSHDSIVQEMSVKSLYTHGTYTHDSGGDPKTIPTLTYDEFLDFHKKWYTPSNCYVYLYGDIPTDKTLEFLDNKFLTEFPEATAITIPKEEEVWVKPQSFHRFTPALEEDNRGSDLLISWKLFDTSSPEEALALEILNRILIGSSAAPLHKALVDNKSWDDLSNASGLENELENFIYTVGVRGASAKDIDKFRSVVFDTLTKVVKDGLNKDLIEGALRGIEFRNREIQSSLGLRLMRKVIRGWLRGQHVLKTLEFEKWMTLIRKKSGEPNYFENLIQKYLLDNQHRADIVIEPSSEETTREKAELDLELKNLKDSFNSDKINQIKNQNSSLEVYQSKPDSKEALNSLPRLTRDDIPSEITEIDTKKVDLHGFDYYKTDLYTNGVVYFGLGFNMEYLDKYFFDYMLIFTRMFTGAGFTDASYDEVSKLVSLNLGGLGASMETSNTLKDGNPDSYNEFLYIRGKVLEHLIPDAFKIIVDFLSKVDFHDYKRLKSVITELRNDLKTSLVANGSSYAGLRSARKYSLSSCREESWYGVTAAIFLDDLVNSFEDEEKLKEVAVILDSIKKELLTKQGLFFHSSTDDKYRDVLENSFKEVIDSLPDGHGFIHPVEHYDLDTDIEGLVGNSKVSYTGVTVKAAYLGSEEYCSSAILCYILKTGYLWENVRMKGGAYGVFASPSGLDGSITFGSYRDPNIVETIEHFKQSLEWIAAGHITQNQIDLALISVIGKELKPLTPVEKSIIGVRRILLGITDRVRKDKRAYLMAVTPQKLMDFAAVVLHHFDEVSTVILSSEDELKKAGEKLEGLLDNLTSLPN